MALTKEESGSLKDKVAMIKRKCSLLVLCAQVNDRVDTEVESLAYSVRAFCTQAACQ